MDTITKPSISRLARRAGVKTISEDCYNTIRELMFKKLDVVLETVLIVNTEHQTKTLMPEDIYNALYLLNHNVSQSNNLGSVSCMK
jgi:histone H3/H4